MKKWFVFLLLSVFFLSCDDELKPSDENVIFDGRSLLNSVVENHILPEFEIFRSDVEVLVNAKTEFVTSKTVENLQILRNAYIKAYTSFQPVAKYGFGLADEINFYRQGFPAIDYLINGIGETDESIIAFYTGSNGNDYTTFLSKVIDRIDVLSKKVADDWNSTFGQTFSNDQGFVNVFVNGYIQYFEQRLRSSKIDFPAGKFDGTPSPETVESIFMPEESRGLLIKALESFKALYIGVNENDSSLSKVLIELGEEGLDAQIKLRFLEAQNLINTLDQNLERQVNTDNTKMLEARDTLQEIVKLLKIDLTSKLNIAIIFRDNDGD